MQCENFKEHIQGYLDKELSDEILQEMRLHKKTCSRCRYELLVYKKCIQMIRNFVGQEMPPENIREKLKQKLGCDCFDKCLPKLRDN